MSKHTSTNRSADREEWDRETESLFREIEIMTTLPVHSGDTVLFIGLNGADSAADLDEQQPEDYIEVEESLVVDRRAVR
ncbi:hypothetical protein ACOZ4I_15610 [Haloarcula salina]|uniref:hypothetical protein n=1 Tax=Haloarcula salina TaxID=1429914 RepID=UPI003C6F52BB